MVPPPCAEDDEDKVDEYFLKVFGSNYEADGSSVSQVLKKFNYEKCYFT